MDTLRTVIYSIEMTRSLDYDDSRSQPYAPELVGKRLVIRSSSWISDCVLYSQSTVSIIETVLPLSVVND